MASMDGDPAGPIVLATTKLSPPPVREEGVRRGRLIDSIERGRDQKLTLVAAPAGFGKTTLLSRWTTHASRNGVTCAWVSLDENDDPVRLWSAIVAAFDRADLELSERLPLAIVGPASSLVDYWLPLVVNELGAIDRKVCLILDDYDRLQGIECHRLIGSFLSRLPDNVRVIISTRADPNLSLPLMRARGELREIRAADLRFTVEEATEFLNEKLGIGVDVEDIESLVERTEGWPAGIYLAALSLRGRTDKRRFIKSFAGDNRQIVDYLKGEVLRALPSDTTAFLIQTSILIRLCGPLCDSVTGRADSTEMLRALEDSNFFLIPLDDRRYWFRYHRLFGDLLKLELVARHPGMLSDLHERASIWYEENGSLEEAIEVALASPERSRAAFLVAAHWMKFAATGAQRVLQRWLRTFPEQELIGNAPLSLVAAWAVDEDGDADEYRRWLMAAERAGFEGQLPDGHASLESGIASCRAARSFDGVASMVENAELAVKLEPRGSRWHPVGVWALAYAHYMNGELEAALAGAEQALELSLLGTFPAVRVLSLAVLSLAEDDIGRQNDALRHAARALELAETLGPEAEFALPTANLAVGRSQGRLGDLKAAERHLERALEIRRERGEPLNLLHALIETATVRYAVGDTTGAQDLLAEGRALTRSIGDAGMLTHLLEQTARKLHLSTYRSAKQGLPQPLSDRELEVLRLLGGTLSFREIAKELAISSETVRSHSRAVYRKLGASSRGDAVDRAHRMGLLSET